jgi:hypothetical protein
MLLLRSTTAQRLNKQQTKLRVLFDLMIVV